MLVLHVVAVLLCLCGCGLYDCVLVYVLYVCWSVDGCLCCRVCLLGVERLGGLCVDFVVACVVWVYYCGLGLVVNVCWVWLVFSAIAVGLGCVFCWCWCWTGF